MAAELGVRLVPGCEVSCRKPAPPAGRAPDRGVGARPRVLRRARGGAAPERAASSSAGTGRVRNRELAARLGSSGRGSTYEDVLAEAGDEGGMGRPHFARALVKAGAVDDIDDAFDRYLADGRPGYVPKARLDPPDVARLAHESGGVAVLAHPLSTGLNPQHLERMVAELAEGGLDGIEAVYSSYTPDQRVGPAPDGGAHRVSWPPEGRTSTARSNRACSWGRAGAISTSPTTSSTRWRPAGAERWWLEPIGLRSSGCPTSRQPKPQVARHPLTCRAAQGLSRTPGALSILVSGSALPGISQLRTFLPAGVSFRDCPLGPVRYPGAPSSAVRTVRGGCNTRSRQPGRSSAWP